ncbi:SGNH/GDSL hydrolase family protein [Kaistella montana]|uniref:SGNH/GDSL hydrolase family protein n=1 Tax=Kaistella montana TaxID=1849733 RepID=A0ABW5KAC6_9FLAO|nr:SGNH/GDSL hydrolase family protein [Kaistella montana]MCQ4035202.1 SGNH/GDSL hydrolase family protein [Kaistella montana]
MKKSILTSALTLMSTLFFAQDFANYAKYEKENAILKSGNIAPTAVFMGDSITEGWFSNDPKFFTDNHFVGRGISGQTTSQMLLRFREDVINLKPKKVIILAGTNDIAENNGPISLEKVFGNIVSMAELAKANRIKVVICSLLPAYEFPWRKGLEPANKVIALNKMLKDFAQKNHLIYVDYHTPLKDNKNGLPTEIAEDGIHPTKLGYAKMEEILMKVLK